MEGKGGLGNWGTGKKKKKKKGGAGEMKLAVFFKCI